MFVKLFYNTVKHICVEGWRDNYTPQIQTANTVVITCLHRFPVSGGESIYLPDNGMLPRALLANARHEEVAGCFLDPSSHPNILNNNLCQSFQNVYMLLWIGGGVLMPKDKGLSLAFVLKMSFTVSSNYTVYQKL